MWLWWQAQKFRGDHVKWQKEEGWILEKNITMLAWEKIGEREKQQEQKKKKKNEWK